MKTMQKYSGIGMTRVIGRKLCGAELAARDAGPYGQCAIVTHEKGSWKWQDAYSVSIYAVAQRKADGLPIYRCISRNWAGKLSAPQLRRRGLASLSRGGLHHRPANILTAEMMGD